MVTEKVLIIEGASDERNGILRQGFHKLLIQKLEGRMPRIIMGDGKKQAIDKYLNYRNERDPSLLIDLDQDGSQREVDLRDNNLFGKVDHVYYMIQEMEAWFLSQPENLDKFYCTKVSSKIPPRPAQDIPNPSDLLNKIVVSITRKRYHKVIHAVELLKLLDASQLINDFEDFRKLIERLKN
jgi:hypothetical protein